MLFIYCWAMQCGRAPPQAHQNILFSPFKFLLCQSDKNSFIVREVFSIFIPLCALVELFLQRGFLEKLLNKKE